MKVNTTRIEVTVMAVALVVLVALAIAPVFWGNAFGQEGRTSTEENAANTSTNKTIDAGQQLSIEGIVIKQHERVTAETRKIEDRVRALHLGPGRPKTTHLIAQEIPK
jgi:hypothetical protein